MVIKPEPAPVFSVTNSLLQRESWTKSSGATSGPGCQEGTGTRARLTLPCGSVIAWNLIKELCHQKAFLACRTTETGCQLRSKGTGSQHRVLTEDKDDSASEISFPQPGSCGEAGIALLYTVFPSVTPFGQHSSS